MRTKQYIQATAVPSINHHISPSPVRTPPNLPGPGAESMNSRRRRSKTKGRSFLATVFNGNVEEVAREMSARNVKLCHPMTGCTALHLAVLVDKPAILSLLLKVQNIALNVKDNEGRTPLHYAAARCDLDGDPTMFYMLTESGARDDIPDHEGFTPLDIRHDPSLIDIERVRCQNKYPYTMSNEWEHLFSSLSESVLTQMIIQGELDLSAVPTMPQYEEIIGRLAQVQAKILGIWDAIMAEDERTLKQLLFRKDMALCRDSEGRTPLHLAYRRGHQGCIDYLSNLCPEAETVQDKKGRVPKDYVNGVPPLTTKQLSDRRGSRTRVLHQSRFQHAHSDSKLMKDKPPRVSMSTNIDDEVSRRILNIDFSLAEFDILEQIQMEGKADQIWATVRRNPSNDALARHVGDFKNLQQRLSSAMDAVEKNNMRRLQQVIDDDVVKARDPRGMRLLHVAVLKERHEMVEFIAMDFPHAINLPDQAGRSAIHYAAAQPNAIYDTLIDLGADPRLTDIEGYTAEAFRRSPDRLRRPASADSSLMLRSMSTDDEFYDPGSRPFALFYFMSNQEFIDTRRAERNGTLSVNVLFSQMFGLFEEMCSNCESGSAGGRRNRDAPTEHVIDDWLNSGDVAKLEQLVLDGRGHMLKEKTSTNPPSKEFLRGLTVYQSKIDAIHKAVEDGDVRRVKSLIDRQQLALARDSYGMTPLHKALLHGQTNTVRHLLAKYPQCVNATDHAGRTPLHYAAADPNGEHMIKVLQKAGGDAFIDDKHGHTPFYYRTHGQRLNVRSMKDNAVMNQLMSGQLSRTLLQDLEEDIYDWIHTGNVGKLEELVLTGYADLLLGRNHEVEDADSIGFLEVLPQYQAKIQAIHKAVETGNLRAVRLLTDRKKLALCRDSRGLSPLHKAIVFDRADIAKYLIRNYPHAVNAMDQKKRTPLHYAAAYRDGGYLYKMMRKSGADPNIYDCSCTGSSQVPIFLNIAPAFLSLRIRSNAKWNGRPAKYYLKHPGEIDLSAMRLDTKAALKQVLHNRVAPSYLESSIQQWLRDGQLAKLEQLVLSGCGDLLQNRNGTNPETVKFLENLPEYMSKIDGIHKAIKEGDLEKVKSIMTSKKLAIARDRFGCTPLHAAVVHEHTEIVRYIAGHFPSVLNAPDYNKRTSMHYAAAARDGGHYLKILGKAGADPMAVDNEGRTPDYYRRNAVIDLKMIKERDEEYDLMNEEMLEDGQMIDSPGSGESGSESGSVIDSARVHDDDDDTDRHRFERMVHGRTDLPTSENGIYLARTVAPVLTKALAEVLLRRPADPIGFISDYLQKYHSEIPYRSNGKLK
ncbi:hypothetical protein RB195_009591 [Necator americanus]|uniref:Ankyrin repeat protein n=1 Tax=Necator americanus TaxID=51031 RepID=A0ABR1CU03_NECAM